MKQTDFALHLHKYFTFHLPSIRGVAPSTIDSYRHTFILFLTFLQEILSIQADRVQCSDLSRDNVLDFLEWLERARGNSVATRNQRQAGINSFVRYLEYVYPEYIAEYQRILGIHVKKAPQKEISYLKTDGVKLFMDQIDVEEKDGLRDYVMMTILYTTGIRVSELINIRVKDLSLHEPVSLLVHGKGRKSRFVPLIRFTIPYIQKYIACQGYESSNKQNEWLFKNHMGNQFSRQGINHIINKYKKRARRVDETKVPGDFSPHKMRHTTAMGLVDSGVDLIYIRDLLGHVSVKTTEVYARADLHKKRLAIEAASRE